MRKVSANILSCWNCQYQLSGVSARLPSTYDVPTCILHKYFERAPLGGGLGELCWSSSVSTDLEFYVDQIGKQHASHHFTEIFQLPQKDPLFRGLGFSLAGSVSSATVVLSRKVRSQKAVEKKLIELKVGVYNVSWQGEGNYLQIFERLFQYETTKKKSEVFFIDFKCQLHPVYMYSFSLYTFNYF